MTRRRIVRRYLAFGVGDRCSEFRRQESERILRAQPFLADAQVVAAPDGHGGAAITVVTTDEVSLVLGASAALKAPVLRAFRLGEKNLGGDAISVVGAWHHSYDFRDVVQGQLDDYQFLGRPYRLRLRATRNPVGGSWDAEVGHPFLTELQRISWRGSAGSFSGYRGLLRPQRPTVALRLYRSYADVGAVHAFGPPRRVVLLGTTLSREHEASGRQPVFLLHNAITPDTSLPLINRYGRHQSTRVNLLVGFRDLQFVRVTGFDALEGAQDVRTGAQVAGLVGRGLKISDMDERDYFVSGDLYAGAASPTAFVGIELMGEGQRNLDTHRFDGILASGRVATYVKPTARQTAIAALEFSGGWRQRIPFQLTLRDREGGIAGYRRANFGGGRRLVARLEDRYRFGHVHQFAAIGGAVFVDAAKLWAGDSPYGVNSGVEVSAGVSLLGAVPPQSRRLWRVDLAIPVNDRKNGRVEVRVSNRDLTQWFWREPGDVQLSRERSIPNSVYNW